MRPFLTEGGEEISEDTGRDGTRASIRAYIGGSRRRAARRPEQISRGACVRDGRVNRRRADGRVPRELHNERRSLPVLRLLSNVPYAPPVER